VFDVGLLELAVIALVAVLVFGPERLPVMAKQAGVMLRKARAMANSARDELRTELGPEYSDLELRDLDPRTIVRKHISEAMKDIDLDADDADDEPRTKDEIAARRRKREQRELGEGELPPYDAEAT
jgi:sec-independent protein translocase protein TatB